MPPINTYFSFDSHKTLKLYDNEIVRLTEFFESLENSSSKKILCNRVENMIA